MKIVSYKSTYVNEDKFDFILFDFIRESTGLYIFMSNLFLAYH